MIIKIEEMSYPAAMTKAIEDALIEIGVNYEISNNEYIALIKEEIKMALDNYSEDVNSFKKHCCIEQLVEEWADDIWEKGYLGYPLSKLSNNMDSILSEYIEELKAGNSNGDND